MRKVLAQAHPSGGGTSSFLGARANRSELSPEDDDDGGGKGADDADAFSGTGGPPAGPAPAEPPADFPAKDIFFFIEFWAMIAAALALNARFPVNLLAQAGIGAPGRGPVSTLALKSISCRLLREARLVGTVFKFRVPSPGRPSTIQPRNLPDGEVGSASTFFSCSGGRTCAYAYFFEEPEVYTRT